MADCSRPPQSQRNLSKSWSSGVFGFRSKGAYDDVFVAEPKMRAPAFTPGVKDYAEIFNCSKSSSIPVLDLDVFEKRDDVVDYGNVFGGGFNEVEIGSSFEEVFAVDSDRVGVRRKRNDLNFQSRGSARSAAVEDGEKLPHDSSFKKNHSMSSDKITRGKKGVTDETNSLDQFTDVPVPARAFDGTVPLKKVGVSRSGATANNFKQDSIEMRVGKHSRKASHIELSNHGAEILIESDMRSRNGYGSDKSVSSDRQLDNDIICPNVPKSEPTAAADARLHLGGSMDTSNDVYAKEGRGGFNSSSQGVCAQSIHGPDKPFIRDSTKVESLVKHNASRSNLSFDLTHDHDAFAIPEVATGNCSARSSTDYNNAKGLSYNYSQQDVKFQKNSSQVNPSDGGPKENYESTPATHSQHSFGKMNTVSEGNVIPEIAGSRNVDSESRDRSSNGFLADGGKLKIEVEHLKPAMNKALASKAKLPKRSTSVSVKDNNSPCSSDDEIDETSEASVSAAAVKKALKEAQALINIAKESNGVKGFMSFVMARNSEQVKVVKEGQENPKPFEPAKVEKNFSLSSARQDSTTPWSTGSNMKMPQADLFAGKLILKGTEFSTTYKPNQIKAVEKQSALREKTQGHVTTQHAPPSFNTFQENLAVHTTVDEKLAHGKEEVALHGIVADSGQVRLEAHCAAEPNIEKRETEVKAASHEAFPNNNPESYTVRKITDPGKESQKTIDSSDKGFLMDSFHADFSQRKAGCSANSFGLKQDAVAVTKYILANQNKAIKLESEGQVSPEFASLEEENVEESKLDSNDRVLDCEDTDSANSFEVKQDAVAETVHILTTQNEAIVVESEGNVSSDSTSLEVENGEGLELDPHDQVLTCEDTDSEEYASAEENWVSTDSDAEVSDQDHHFSAQKNLNEIEELENMVVPEVTVITKDVLPPSHRNLHEDQIVEGIDDMALQNNLTKESHVASPILNSDENPEVEETHKSKDIPLVNTVTPDSEVTSEEVTAPILNEDPVAPDSEVTSAEVTAPVLKEDSAVEEADGSENMAFANGLVHEAKFTSEETTVPVFNNSDEDPIVEEADINEDASVLFTVSPNATITSEYGSPSCFNSANGVTSVETEGIENTTEQNMVKHEAVIIFVNDIAPCLDNSNENMTVGDNVEDTSIVSSMSLHSDEHEVAIAAPKLHEQTILNVEMSDYVAVVETESASCSDHESSHNEGSEVKLFSTDDLAENPVADAIEESRTFETEKQDVDGTNSFILDTGIKDRGEFEQSNNAGVEADATEDGHVAVNVKVFENDHVSVGTVGEEDATETESPPWDSEPVNHKLEAEAEVSEPLQDCGKRKETTEFEQLNENFIQPVERHERRKWAIPNETFELPELETGAPETEDTMKQDINEMERQMNKHERKKWEIPAENFELPVLGDAVVEENEEHTRHDTDIAAQSAEKPERKKWKIQKEVFEVPILCTEAVHDSPEHEGFVIKTPAAEETADNLSNTVMFPEEMLQHEDVQNDFSLNEKAVPDEASSCELHGKNAAEEISKDWMPELSSDEEQHKQLNEISDQQDTKVGAGNDVRQKDCAKGAEEVNVKDEIKRTLGMLWKKIYNVKQDETSESAELVGKDKVSSKDRIRHGIEMDLNLKGPVELVESPRHQNDIETLNFSGNIIENEESREAASYSEPSTVNESGEFVSMETSEARRSSPLAFDSCKNEEDENYNANHPEAQSEEALSSSESENWTEMAPTREACDLKKEGTLKGNDLPSNGYELKQTDSETDSGSNPLIFDENVVDNAESTQKTNVLHQNGLDYVHDDIPNANVSEVEMEMHHADDLSDKRRRNSEQQDTSSSREDNTSGSESEVPDVTMSHGLEQKADKIEQACTLKWIFGDDKRDKSNGQDEGPDVKVLREVKGMTKEKANEINSTHGAQKEKLNCAKPTSVEDSVPEPKHKEATPNQDVLKDLGRAKELERIAVERAIREARERAFNEARERAAKEKANAEARERAAKDKTNLESRERIASERANAEARERASEERANADAHHRVTSNVQERAQRTSSDAKLASEKNSLEAKRKAELERAAVERATTEARQRALEKAMSRKEQVTQSSSGSASSSGDQYGSSSQDDKPSESALRFKARNERHQRIAERAAKALAEKNMRDLLVQREQAERNRLAEVLDADVKRWARGKTGNLRSLLSTLQYILGPDSGWQAIHLTEIVTADAVKKAYRKATLFVHPDKLQQRGATIRQKYICEKVFDLLKEAWNKFDRDER